MAVVDGLVICKYVFSLVCVRTITNEMCIFKLLSKIAFTILDFESKTSTDMTTHTK